MSYKSKPEMTLLLPVYNESKAIEQVISEFYEKVGKTIPLEIMIVEDGSTDGTKKILYELSRKLPLKLISSKKRKGYSKALADGLKKVNTNFVVCVDSDAQFFPEDLLTLLKYRNKYDIVSGSRIKRDDSIHRRIMSNVFQFSTKILFNIYYLQDITCPYKLIKTPVAKKIAHEMKYMKESFWTEFIIRAHELGYKIKEVPVHHKKSLFRSTNIYTLLKTPSIISSHIFGLIKLRLEH